MQQSQETSSISSSSSSEQLLLQHTKPVHYAFMFLRSSDTQRQYPKRLKLLFDYLKLEGNDDIEEQAKTFLAKAQDNQKWAQEVIMLFLDTHKQRVREGKLAAGTIKNIYRPIKMFCEQHDLIAINWKRISMSLPLARKAADDRVPTIEEIRKVCEFPDRRVKPIVYTMCSSGIRVAAWDYLKWKHISPIKDEKTGEIIVAAKIIVYAGEPEEYVSFITPEAYNALKQYIDFRASYGEKITGESWVMRDKWKTIEERRKEKTGGVNGLAIAPKRLSSNGIRKILNRAYNTQGVRPALAEGEKRHDTKESHGFRKYFETYTETANIKTSYVKILIGHSQGVEDSYNKPNLDILLSEYLKAVERLTINSNQDQTTLKKQVEELTEKSEQQNYVIKGLTENEKKEAEETKTKLAVLEAQQQERFREMQEQIESLSKLALKQAFRVIEKETETNPPPYIEGADKMSVAQVLSELQKRGVTSW